MKAKYYVQFVMACCGKWLSMSDHQTLGRARTCAYISNAITFKKDARIVHRGRVIARWKNGRRVLRYRKFSEGRVR